DDGPRRRDRLPARGGGAGQEGGPGGGRRPRREVPQRDRPDRPGDHAGLTPATAPPAPATSGVARRPVAVGRDRPVRRRRRRAGPASPSTGSGPAPAGGATGRARPR